MCVSVNDPFVMAEWARDQEAENVFLLPDGNGLFTEKIRLGFFLESGLEHTGAGATDGAAIGERELLGVAGRVLVNGDKAGDAAAFLEHYGLASLADLPGAREMKALGLLSLDLPANFTVPDPTNISDDEDPLEPGDAPEFHQDFLGEEV